MGDEGAHPELAGQGEGSIVVGLSCPRIRRAVFPGDVAEEAQTPRLAPSLLLPVRNVKRAPRDGNRITRVTGQEKQMVDGARGLGVHERFLYEDHAFLEAPRQRVRISEVRSRDVKEHP